MIISPRIYVFGLLLIGLLSSCSSGGNGATKNDNVTIASGDLPDITLLPEEGEQFSTNTLQPHTILIFFSPDCDHCQREAQHIHEQFAAFKDYSIYFISMDSYKAMHQFAVDYRLSNLSSVHFVRADGQSVLKALGDVTTPTICVYGNDRKLTKRFDGETPVEAIISAL